MISQQLETPRQKNNQTAPIIVCEYLRYKIRWFVCSDFICFTPPKAVWLIDVCYNLEQGRPTYGPRRDFDWPGDCFWPYMVMWPASTSRYNLPLLSYCGFVAQLGYFESRWARKKWIGRYASFWATSWLRRFLDFGRESSQKRWTWALRKRSWN